jgi:hypothetical protein
MNEVLDEEFISNHKQGQTFKYNKQSIDHLDIMAHFTGDVLPLIANVAANVAGEFSAEDEFDYDKFEHFYMAWEEGNIKSVVEWKIKYITNNIREQ